jgi:hypothetical protein
VIRLGLALQANKRRFFMGKQKEYLEELNQIAAQNEGMLRPADVVSFASNPSTVLHGCFTWDNTEAAEAWRLQQARQLIRVTVIVLPGDHPLKSRAYVSLKEDRYNDQGYRAMVDVMSDGRLKEILLAEALIEAQTFMAKYESLKELSLVFAEIRKVIKKPIRKPRSTRTTKYRRPQAVAVG